MTSTLIKPLLIVYCLLLISIFGNAQTNNCSDKLSQAQQLFESGQIEQIPFLLDSCLNSGFTKDQKIQAYRLLIQTYLFDSNITMADSIMLKLLSQNPDYKIARTDPVEFSELYNNFKVKYQWSAGVLLGANFPRIRVIENYSLFNINKLNSTYSSIGPGIDAGFYGNLYIKNYLWVTGGLDYSSLNYKRTDINSLKTEQVNFDEYSNWLTIPVTLNHSFLNTKIKPIAQAGFEIDYLASDNGTIQRLNYTGNTVISNISASSIDLSGYRNKFNLAFLFGIGAVMNTDYGLFQLILGDRLTLLTYVNPNTRYSNNNMIYYYQHIDDNFKINNIYLTIGWSHLLYTIKNNRINEASH